MILYANIAYSFLDKAAIKTVDDEIKSDGSAADPWTLCSVQQVEELKCLLRVIPIWTAGVLYYIVIVQNSTYLVVQALQSDRRFVSSFTIPAASFTIFAMIALTVWIPVYDRLVVPSIRRLTGKDGGISLLQRVGIGIFLSVIAMIFAGLVERHRRHVALHRPTLDARGMVSSMSALWLVPQLTIAGLSEAFSVIGQIEFYYKQFPENMRSVAGSLFFIGMACANYLSGMMVSIVHHTTNSGSGGGGGGNWLPEDLNKGRLEYFYFMLAAMEAANFVYFLGCSSWYRYKGEDGAGAKPSEIGMEERNE
ncbi:hypothetical protein ACLOJK_030306 [Asimina triloba]